jgi:MFS family permease
VLGAFVFQSFIQCVCFMDFSTDEALVEETLHTEDPSEIGHLYYGGFASTVVAMFYSLWLLLSGRDWRAGLGMAILIVAGAWLRLIAAHAHSYALALLSTLSLGLAGGVIFTSITFLPERWFPEHERPFATALAVQSNYAGWAVGCLTPVMFGKPGPDGEHTQTGMRTYLLWQALLTSLALPIYLAANTRGPRAKIATNAVSSSAEGAGGVGVGGNVVGVVGVVSAPRTLSMRESFATLCKRPQYLIHSTCYAVLGAVGYAVTGAVDVCFTSAFTTSAANGTATSAFTSDHTMWLNFAFVLTGVLTGLAAGKLTPTAWYGAVIRALFATGAFALLAIQLLLNLGGAQLSKVARRPRTPPSATRTATAHRTQPRRRGSPSVCVSATSLRRTRAS